MFQNLLDLQGPARALALVQLGNVIAGIICLLVIAPLRQPIPKGPGLLFVTAGIAVYTRSFYRQVNHHTAQTWWAIPIHALIGVAALWIAYASWQEWNNRPRPWRQTSLIEDERKTWPFIK